MDVQNKIFRNQYREAQEISGNAGIHDIPALPITIRMMPMAFAIDVELSLVLEETFNTVYNRIFTASDDIEK